MFSPVVTIGGGVVLDTTAHRYRRGEPAADRLRVLECGAPAERVALLVRESKFGLGIGELVAATGLLDVEIRQAAESAGLIALKQPEFWLLDCAWFRDATARLTAALRDFHARNPLAAGMSKQELRSRELPGAPLFLLDALVARADGIRAEGITVRLLSHKVVLKQDEEQASGSIEKAFLDTGLTVPPVAEVLRTSGVEPVPARSLLQMLIRQGKLVKIGDDMIFHRAALDGLRARLAPHRGQRLTVSRFKDLAAVSRKYAIPLLEYLDRERITRRDGDDRIIL
jgi:selenocysteine-specific elongation factor